MVPTTPVSQSHSGLVHRGGEWGWIPQMEGAKKAQHLPAQVPQTDDQALYCPYTLILTDSPPGQKRHDARP